MILGINNIRNVRWPTSWSYIQTHICEWWSVTSGTFEASLKCLICYYPVSLFVLLYLLGPLSCYSWQFYDEPALPSKCSLPNYFWKNVHVDCLAVILFHLNGRLMSGSKHRLDLPERAREVKKKSAGMCSPTFPHLPHASCCTPWPWFTASE